MPNKSPKVKPVRASKPAAQPKQNSSGCLRRVGLPLALLFGGCMVLSVVVSAVQNVGERIGLLPTSTPKPTPTVTLTPSATPTVTDTPPATATPAPTDTVMATNTLAPTDTPAATATAPAPPTVTNTATPPPAPTDTLAPTHTPTAAPLAQRSEPVALPLGSAPAVPATTTDANLRSGPGQQFPVVGGTVAGQPLTDDLAPVGQSADGQWFALANGSWIAASLVVGAPSGLTVVSAPEAPEPVTAQPAATALPAAAPEATADTQAGTSGGNPWPEYTCADNPSPPPNPACPIKGNISSEHIYHMPGQRDYCKTVIDESAGERWFCSPQEAEAASWRAAQR